LTVGLRVLSSTPFRFSVGPQEREFTIHSALVAEQSDALERLVNGNMKEACDQHVLWNSVEEDIFIKFSQFAYTGNYDSEQPERSAETTPELGPQQEIAEESDDVVDLGWGRRKKKKHSGWPSEMPETSPTKKEQLWDRFKAFTSSEGLQEVQMRSNTKHENCTAVFLSHAKLYVFADIYGIKRLAMLSLYRLQQALVVFELFDNRLEDVVELVRYCFEDTVPDELRLLVTLYVACNVEKLWKSSNFHNLICEHGELSMSLIGMLLDRLD
jgi:hypothetical protein